MEANRDEAAQICEYAQGDEQYGSVSRPLHTRDNVCVFFIRGYSEPGRTLVRHERFMAQGGVACPVQTDKRYIPVSGISEGLFNILANFAADLASSPGAFDSAVSMDMTKNPDYDSLRRGILEGDPVSRFQLEGMEVSEPSLSGALRYQLIFQSPSLPIRCIMDVDFTSSGLKILAFGRVR